VDQLILHDKEAKFRVGNFRNAGMGCSHKNRLLIQPAVKIHTKIAFPLHGPLTLQSKLSFHSRVVGVCTRIAFGRFVPSNFIVCECRGIVRWHRATALRGSVPPAGCFKALPTYGSPQAGELYVGRVLTYSASRFPDCLLDRYPRTASFCIIFSTSC
jgi:hypothetical protein